jgi:energy-coupling factor transporter ATP-binding protein EcfA2
MSLLELENVSRRLQGDPHGSLLLRNVSLSLEAGELVAVWGKRRSGRSTLLRVASGIEPPDEGIVRFAGRNLAGSEGYALGGGIGYCRRAVAEARTRVVLDELMVAQLARGIPRSSARARSLATLQRVGAEQTGARLLRELDGGEAIRVTVARALVLEPSLLVLDEPTIGVDVLERDGIVSLLRSLADDGIAVLICTGDTAALSGADRALSLAEGELHGSSAPELATVLPLRRRAGA